MTLENRLEALPAGGKLCGLAVLATALMLLGSVPVLAAAAAASLVLCLAVLGSRRLRAAAPAGVAITILAVVLFTLAVDGPEQALVVLLRLCALLLLAHLVTATTRASEIQDAIVAGLRPLERLPRVSAEKTGLAIALALRAVPRIGAAAAELREAREARGLKIGSARLVVPLVVRILADAREIADAIDARSWSGASGSKR